MQCHFVVYQELSDWDIGLCLAYLAIHDTGRWNKGYHLDCQSLASHCKRGRKLFSMKSATRDRTYIRRTYHQDPEMISNSFQRRPLEIQHVSRYV